MKYENGFSICTLAIAQAMNTNDDENLRCFFIGQGHFVVMKKYYVKNVLHWFVV